MKPDFTNTLLYLMVRMSDIPGYTVSTNNMSHLLNLTLYDTIS